MELNREASRGTILSSLFSEACDEVNKIEKEYEKRILERSLSLLRKAFPEDQFLPEQIRIGITGSVGHSFCYGEHSTSAVYQDNNLCWYRVAGTDVCYKVETSLASDIKEKKPLFVAKSQSYTILATQREKRKCKMSVHFTNSGERCTYWGFSVNRLAHEDSYGYEYVVLDGEKHYLEPYKEVK